jgi:ubiquinone/menaquinone biosynthesis C-methylase UbiE
MLPPYLAPVSRYFRQRRNRPLVALIESLAPEKNDPVNVLDVGGSIVFWLSIPEAVRAKCRICLVNLPGEYETWPENELRLKSQFELVVGDARDLSRYGDRSFDLVVCNSVLEHVGSWADIEAAAGELVRVGRRGWVQVPAFEFPIEQHFLIPFVHWFAAPIQMRVLDTFHGHFKRRTYSEQQMSIYHARPLARGELRRLLPQARLHSEWLVLPKSHVATW